ncbi:porin family protein [Methylovirgula ligni]|uniref:Outer membrane immunogenic protein n=1 Tax=Methylovirgula ligni TaxID=569860 RepID=A0A3D9YUI6_9HYPH|nr:outer membrane protein [Methylovirgula ligni]QAY94965.1 porin family protein [Methylovirgula ligni]REF84582.1 outer membrane immunogenic protein [Methylovirgula ligni]
MSKSLVAIVFISAISGSALAADLPNTKEAPVFTPAPVLSWTGFYAGLNAGYVAADVDVRDVNGGVTPGPFSYHPDGGFGGGQLGYNYQFNQFVVGIEGDVGYIGLQGKGIIGSAAADHHQDLTLDSGVYGDITGRVGYAFGPALIYAKGGYAWFGGSAEQTTTNPGYVTTGTSTFSGWTAGGGVEYLITQNISVKAEYLHFDFGSKGGYQTNVGDDSSPIGYEFWNETSLRFDTVKVGLNYRFW